MWHGKLVVQSGQLCCRKTSPWSFDTKRSCLARCCCCCCCCCWWCGFLPFFACWHTCTKKATCIRNLILFLTAKEWKSVKYWRSYRQKLQLDRPNKPDHFWKFATPVFSTLDIGVICGGTCDPRFYGYRTHTLSLFRQSIVSIANVTKNLFNIHLYFTISVASQKKK